MLRQFTTSTTAVGSSVMGGIRSTAGVLIPKSSSGSSVNESEHVTKVNKRVEVEDDEAAFYNSQYPDMSNVSLSSDDNDSEPNSPIKQTKHTNEGFLGQIKNTSETAGTAIIGGLKATTNLLNPMNLVKPSDGGEAEREKNNKKTQDEFDHIYIDESVEEEDLEKPKPKPSFLETIKTKTGLHHPAPSDTERSQQSRQQQPPRPPDHYTDNQHKEPHKESFLDQIKSRTGLQQNKDKPREEDIARNSAPKDGFLSQLKATTSKVNPFATSTDHHAQPTSHSSTTNTHNNSTTQGRFQHNSTGHNSSSSNNNGITGMFDSITGKSNTTTTKRPEPAKQASFFDHITGKSSPPPKKEPGFFDQITGNTGKPAKSNSDSSFW